MIVILDTWIDNDLVTSEPASRGVLIWITDNITNYVHTRGNLPLEGDLLSILQANEAAIWLDAVAVGDLATAAQTAKAERLQWLIDNPGAKQIFTLSKVALETEINDTVDIVFAGQTAANRTKIKRLWMCGALLDREQIAEE